MQLLQSLVAITLLKAADTAALAAKITPGPHGEKNSFGPPSRPSHLVDLVHIVRLGHFVHLIYFVHFADLVYLLPLLHIFLSLNY